MKSNIRVNIFIGAKVPLQSLLDDTVSRLLQIVDIPTSVNEMKLISKWGCDGSSGYTEFMNKPVHTNSDELEVEEENAEDNVEGSSGMQNLFLMSLVPLRLIGNPDSGRPVVL